VRGGKSKFICSCWEAKGFSLFCKAKWKSTWLCNSRKPAGVSQQPESLHLLCYFEWFIIQGMNVKKCDICKKSIEGHPVRAGADFFSDKDFCSKCGKPVLDFLKKHKLVKEEK
jgi:hypothetical protein